MTTLTHVLEMILVEIVTVIIKYHIGIKIVSYKCHQLAAKISAVVPF